MAQEGHVDSLIQSLETAIADTNKVNIMLDISLHEYRQTPVDAILYGQEARRLSEQLGFKKGVAFALKYIGLGHYFKGDYWEAISSWEQSLKAI
jgi:hypothetical protein